MQDGPGPVQRWYDKAYTVEKEFLCVKTPIVISAVDYPMSLPQARSFQDLYRILRDLYTTIYSNLLLLRYTMQKEYGRGGRI